MRYRVVNLHRMGGMLEDYQSEINNLKDRLNRGGYSQPGPTPVYAPPTPPPGRPYMPEESGIVPYAPPTVSTGIPPMPYTYPFVEYPYPPVPPPSSEPCPPGYTRTPSGCMPNVPSVDRYFPPVPPPSTIVSEPPPPAAPVTTPTSATSEGGPCPPGTTPVHPGASYPNCLPDVATHGGGGGGVQGGGFAVPGGLFSGGGGASAISLMGRLPYSGRPALLQPIRLRGY